MKPVRICCSFTYLCLILIINFNKLYVLILEMENFTRNCHNSQIYFSKILTKILGNSLYSKTFIITRVLRGKLETKWQIYFIYYTGLQNFSRKCPLFGFWLISNNFGPLIPNPKSVFGCVVWSLHCCQFCVFRVKIYIFELFSKFIIFKNLSFFNMKRE